MAWHDEQPWAQQRARLEREALAASVEEMATQHSLMDEEWEEEPSPGQEASPVFQRLRLQSRPNRVAGTNMTRPIGALHEHSFPMTRPMEALRPTDQKPGQRLAGRSTKVHLEAVHPNAESERSTGQIPRMNRTERQRYNPLNEPPFEGQAAAQDTNQNPAGAFANASLWPRLPGGRGLITQGQGAVTIPNASVTERCVVTVMLAGNPGPVVVHYVSLHPRMGFTVHLSSPATTSVPFNYVIWPF